MNTRRSFHLLVVCVFLVGLFASPGSSQTVSAASTRDRGAVSPVEQGSFAPQAAPVASDASFSTNEDTAYTIGQLIASGEGTLTYIIIDAPGHGSLSAFDAAAGTFTYTPTANYNGADSFTFKVNDTVTDSNPATISITVTGVNDVPVAQALDMGNTPEETAKGGTLLATDVEGSALSFSVVTPPASGVLNPFHANNGTFTYTPNTDFNGDDSFTFRAYDGTDYSAPATVSITVTPVNDPPISQSLGLGNSPEDTDKSGQLVATDVDNATLSYGVVSGPGHGSLPVFNAATGEFTYRPAANYNGGDSLTFRAYDGADFSNTATVTITITAVNDPPVASDGSFTTAEDTSYTIGQLTSTHVDSDPPTYSKTSGPSHGTAVVNANGSFTYTPTANYNGGDSFTFDACDIVPTCDTGTISITVTPVNDPPVATDDGFTTAEDTPYTTGQLAATHVDGGTLTYSKESGPSHGTEVVNANGSFTYTPTANYHGTDSFLFQVCDSAPECDTGTISITITSVADAPVAEDGALSVTEDLAQSGQLVATDGDGDTLTYSIVTPPAHGGVVIDDIHFGAYTYTPSAEYNGPDSFTFKANDGTSDSNTATITVTVAAANDPPVATGQSITTAEDTPKDGTLAASDIDSSTLAYSKVADPTNGAVTVRTDGSFTYTPDPNYHGSDSFTFKASDGIADSNIATVSITVTPANDPPVAANLPLGNSPEDTTKSGTVEATDIDGDPLTYSLVTDPAHGSLTAFNVGTGQFTYLPAANYNGPDSFTFKANDGTVDSNIATVSITITAVNDPPVLQPLTLGVIQDTPTDGQLVGSDVDTGDVLTYSKVTDPTNGSITTFSTTTGHFIYSPNLHYSGPDSFQVSVCDNYAACTPDLTVNINVASNNHAPTANNQDFAVTMRTLTSIEYPGTMVAQDEDSWNTLSYEIVSGKGPYHGIVTIDASTGSFIYKPTLFYYGTDRFTFRVTDGFPNSFSNEATISIMVNRFSVPPPVGQTDTMTPHWYKINTPEASLQINGTNFISGWTGSYTYLVRMTEINSLNPPTYVEVAYLSDTVLDTVNLPGLKSISTPYPVMDHTAGWDVVVVIRPVSNPSQETEISPHSLLIVGSTNFYLPLIMR